MCVRLLLRCLLLVLVIVESVQCKRTELKERILTKYSETFFGVAITAKEVIILLCSFSQTAVFLI